ncbi:MAG: TIR domain-containing protein [Bacteroidota bacterium]
MWPIIVGAGVLALILKAFSHESDGANKSRKTKDAKPRIFISFAIEDEKYRDYLVEQSKLQKSPFDFVDMSVKQPWNENEWKAKCRTKIKKCDGMIALLSKNTWQSSGARWEMLCAHEEGIPIFGMHVKKNDKGAIPPELKGKKVIEWSWEGLASQINNM